MRLFSFATKVIVVVTVAVHSGVAQAGPTTTFGLYTENTSSQSITAHPGDALNLWVRLDVADSAQVAYAWYDVLLPQEGWDLMWRRYTEDQDPPGLWSGNSYLDGSVPRTGDTYPVTILGDTYISISPDAPDFGFFDAASSDLSGPGLFTVESFQLRLPGSLAPGVYEIGLQYEGVANGSFSTLDTEVVGTYQVHVTDQTAIPEPGTLTFALAGLGLLAVLRRRRDVA